MTGQGQALVSGDGCTVQAEIRSVNNRFLKISVRAGERFGELAPRAERLIQAKVRRGTLTLSLKISLTGAESPFRLNEVVLAGYKREIHRATGLTEELSSTLLAALLPLPGVVEDTYNDPEQIEALWPVVATTVEQAIERLNEMRAVEGDAMGRDLAENLEQVAREVQEIERRAPAVSLAYQHRILERIRQMLASAATGASNLVESPIGPVSVDLVKEVAVFADRCDFSEELVRLRSHLGQFHSLLQERESQGRKMDFLTQELFREINTIGSKANDAEIASHVVAVKTWIERMREMVQNIE